jgi:hypothetical protein
MLVSEFTVTPDAATPPKVTAVAPVKPDPVTVTDVPPAAEPAAGETPVTVGTMGAAVKVNWSAGVTTADCPIGVVTRTFVVAAACAGETATMLVSEFTVTPDAATPPKVTAVAPVKPVPVIVTDVPPATGPDAGDTPDTTGVEPNVNWSAGVTTAD